MPPLASGVEAASTANAGPKPIAPISLRRSLSLRRFKTSRTWSTGGATRPRPARRRRKPSGGTPSAAQRLTLNIDVGRPVVASRRMSFPDNLPLHLPTRTRPPQPQQRRSRRRRTAPLPPRRRPPRRPSRKRPRPTTSHRCRRRFLSLRPATSLPAAFLAASSSAP